MRPTRGSRPTTPPKAPTTPPPAATARPRVEAPAGAVVLAAVAGAHGIGGEVRLKVFGDDLSPHRTFNNGALTLSSLRDGTIARFAEVSDRSAAEALRGTQLWVSRDALPPLGEGEYYHADLIGLAAVSTDGSAVGRVVAVENFGAGDVVEIERDAIDGRGKRFMVPMHAVPEWGDGRLTVEAGFVE
ncbi:ribosome maturation factor RimM [Sphingomonas sp. Leaf412]|uniref:ribosome maturation factor RimM n=1 Tax=Sphingomonas sp. Leaf412 TaxID=1736370 RepID=UPI0039DFD1E5